MPDTSLYLSSGAGEWIGGGITRRWNSLYMFCFATLVVAPRLKADVVMEETIFP